MYPSAHRFAVLTGKGFRRHAERQGERKVAAVQPVAALAGGAAGGARGGGGGARRARGERGPPQWRPAPPAGSRSSTPRCARREAWAGPGRPRLFRLLR